MKTKKPTRKPEASNRVGSSAVLGDKFVTVRMFVNADELVSLCNEASLILKNLSDFRTNVRSRILEELSAGRLKTTTRTRNFRRRGGKNGCSRFVIRLVPSRSLKLIVSALRALDFSVAHKILNRRLSPNDQKLSHGNQNAR